MKKLSREDLVERASSLVKKPGDQWDKHVRFLEDIGRTNPAHLSERQREYLHSLEQQLLNMPVKVDQPQVDQPQAEPAERKENQKRKRTPEQLAARKAKLEKRRLTKATRKAQSERDKAAHRARVEKGEVGAKPANRRKTGTIPIDEPKPDVRLPKSLLPPQKLLQMFDLPYELLCRGCYQQVKPWYHAYKDRKTEKTECAGTCTQCGRRVLTRAAKFK